MRQFEFELPVGYVDDEGRAHRTAVLRKMTGHEEAMLADRKLRQNGGKLVTEILTSCLLEIGEIRPANRQIVAHLTSADRNYLLLELRKITFGSELNAGYVCPGCQQTTRVVEDLDELPVRRLNGDGSQQLAIELEDGYTDRGDLTYTSFVFRFPNGVDEEKVAGTLRDNPSHGMNALLARCLVAVGDMPPNRRDALGTKLLSDLTMSDRARIEQGFRKEMPGVDQRRQVRCDSCGRQFSATLDLTGFFSLE